MSYQGKILLFNDAKKRTHLIFNHYDHGMSQSQIHTQIKNQFGLDYKFGTENEMASVYDSGSVLTEISDKNTPEQLLKQFDELSHPDVASSVQANSPTDLTGTDVRVILYTKMEPPYGAGVAAQNQNGIPPKGGRYYKTNYALTIPTNKDSDRAHSNNWDGYNPVRYVITNTSPVSIAQNLTSNINDTKLAVLGSNENKAASGSILDLMPKSIFYVYSRTGDEFLTANFATDANRVYQKVKPYLIGGDVVATTTLELEQTVQTSLAIIDSSFNKVDVLIKDLTKKDIELDREITNLKAEDAELQVDIDTRETKVNVASQKTELQDQINSLSENIQSISSVVAKISAAQHNFYNYEWYDWARPPTIDEKKEGSDVVMVELSNIQSRVERKRRVVEDTTSMVKNIKADIAKLAKINSTVLELLNGDL
jgi:hypothetical protein